MVTQLSVTRTFRWEAAHRIIRGYQGKCAHVHGHSWRARITVSLRPGAQLDKAGFVKDFDDLNRVGDWIAAYWDHATLVAAHDQELLEFLRRHDQRHFVTPDNPTSEAVCELLLECARRCLDDERCQVTEVWVAETCLNEATLRVRLRGAEAE